MYLYRLLHYHFYWILLATVCIVTFFSESSFAQGNVATTGSGYCLDFTPNMSNGNHVDLGTLSAIDTGNFSIEMWVNVNACKGDPAFFSNKDWSSGNNPGMVFDVHDNGAKLRINLKPANAAFQNYILPINAIGRGWFHLAVTLNRGTYLKIYIDGILKSSTYLIDTLKGSFTSPYAYKLGQDGTGAYSDDNGKLISFDGKLDEVRIWKTERTEDEIKANMCRKILPSSPYLYAYYNCDATAGNLLSDATGAHEGKWINGVPGNWAVSGAAIGDTSVALYPDSQDWNGKEIGLSDSLPSEFKVKNIQAVEGMHVFKTDSKPNFINGLHTFSDNTTYYGVFMAGVSSSSVYTAQLNYSNYPTAISSESTVRMFTRNQNSDHIWSEYVAEQDTLLHRLIKAGIKRRHEFMIGSRGGISCAASTLFSMGTNTDSTCEVNWEGGGGQTFNVQWSQPGFELGTGKALGNISKNQQQFTGLKAGSFYEMYIQDICSPGNTSYWVGPFTFYPLSCMSPTNFMASQITEKSALLSWKGNGYKSDVEWGLLGFKLGQGIPDSTFTDSLFLTGLMANTNYAYYVKSNCPAGSNNFNGPFTFKTLGKAGINDNELARNFSLFPNPGNGEFTLLVNTSARQLFIHVYNTTGKEIFHSKEAVKNSSVHRFFDWRGFPKGLYLIRITDGTYAATESIIIQ
jgi:hypothetical protein